MKLYTVRIGDTFETISRINYGTTIGASRISAANPQIGGKLSAGQVISIPDAVTGPSAPPPEVEADGTNEVSITIDGKQFRFWSDVEIVRSMDSFSVFSLSAPFEPDDAEFREAFVPLKFQTVVVYLGGQAMFTGQAMTTAASLAVPRTVFVTGYSLAGVLNDCTLPLGNNAHEIKGSDLRVIATSMLAPFGLTPTLPQDAGPTFTQVGLAVGANIFGFLIKLAKQRGFVISDDANGMPVFQEEATGLTVAELVAGESPLLGAALNVDPQSYYSSVTAITPTTTFYDPSSKTVYNPHLSGIVRPLMFDAGDTYGGDAQKSVEAATGRMFANAISYTVQVAGWRDANGDLWQPNTLVSLMAPDAMVYNATEFLVRSVSLSRDARKDLATLNLVLPGSFSGNIPEVLPWDS